MTLAKLDLKISGGLDYSISSYNSCE